MKRSTCLAVSIFISFFVFTSCQPRIDLDLGQWEDHAYINNVKVFTLEESEQKLQEYFENEVLTPARRRKFVSEGEAIIDSSSFTATVKVPGTLDLSRTGLIFYHQAKEIIPLNGSPRAGIITDLSVKKFSYRVISSDGSKHDWTILIQTE